MKVVFHAIKEQNKRPYGQDKIERTNSMYKFRTGWEKDHERWEEVDGDEQCEDCGELNRDCQCTETVDDEPVAEKSLHGRYGFDERDRPPEEEEEERGYLDEPDEPLDQLKYRWR